MEKSALRNDANDAISKVQRLWPVVEHIDRNIHQPLSRKNLAEVLSVSPSRLHSLFQECMGVSPMTYVRKRRLQESRKHFSNNDATIQSIADALGFSDAFDFSKKFGESPSGFRKNCRTLFRE